MSRVQEVIKKLGEEKRAADAEKRRRDLAAQAERLIAHRDELRQRLSEPLPTDESPTVTTLGHMRALADHLPTTTVVVRGLSSYELRPLLLMIIDAQLAQEERKDAHAKDKFQKQRERDAKSLGYTEAALADIERELEDAKDDLSPNA